MTAAADLPPAPLAALLDRLAQLAAHSCGLPHAAVILADASGECINAHLPDAPQLARAFCARTLQVAPCLQVHDLLEDPHWSVHPSGPWRCLAGAPLKRVDGSRAGVLLLAGRRRARMSAQQTERLLEHAAAIAQALETHGQLRAELHHQQALYRAQTDAAPVGVFHADSRGSFTYTNQRWLEIFGCGVRESLGEGWVVHVHDDDRGPVLARWREAVTVGAEFDVEFRPKPGPGPVAEGDTRVVHVRARAQAVRDKRGAVEGYVGNVVDISRRIDAQDRLRASEAFLDRTGRIAGIGGWQVDLKTQEIHWSDHTCRIHECPPGHRPTLDEAQSYFAKEDRPVIDAAVRRGVDHGTPWDLELPFYPPSGRRGWVRAVGEVEFENGEPVRLIGAFQDITERRERLAELRHEQDLRLQLQRHAAELDRLLGERDRMLDVLAHEVRQPLNNASAALQSAETAVAAASGTADSLAALRLQRAQNVMGQVMASIDNTLAAASLLVRAESIELEDGDIDTLLALAIGDMPAAERSRVRVERATQTRTASMDMSLMRLALRNVLSNGLKYSPAEAPVVLRLSDSDEPLALVIDVIDQGHGVEPGLLPRLFERGARGRIQRHVPGHGLGLYIVRRVMELHDGSAELVRNGPDGATMRLMVGQAALQ